MKGVEEDIVSRDQGDITVVGRHYQKSDKTLTSTTAILVPLPSIANPFMANDEM